VRTIRALSIFLGVVQAIVRSEPIPLAPRPTHFEAPGIKLQGVTMENVNIHVGTRRAADDDENEDETPTPVASPAREKSSFSSSMFITRAIGVIFPLVGFIIFIFAMGGMACDQGNAPGAFCRALDALRN